MTPDLTATLLALCRQWEQEGHDILKKVKAYSGNDFHRGHALLKRAEDQRRIVREATHETLPLDPKAKQEG